MLELDNGNALKELTNQSRVENEMMLKLSKKATSDAAAVKVLTVTTLVYLPATVVLVSRKLFWERMLTCAELLLNRVCSVRSFWCHISHFRMVDLLCNNVSSHRIHALDLALFCVY